MSSYYTQVALWCWHLEVLKAPWLVLGNKTFSVTQNKRLVNNLLPLATWNRIPQTVGEWWFEFAGWNQLQRGCCIKNLTVIVWLLADCHSCCSLRRRHQLVYKHLQACLQSSAFETSWQQEYPLCASTSLPCTSNFQQPLTNWWIHIFPRDLWFPVGCWPVSSNPFHNCHQPSATIYQLVG